MSRIKTDILFSLFERAMINSPQFQYNACCYDVDGHTIYQLVETIYSGSEIISKNPILSYCDDERGMTNFKCLTELYEDNISTFDYYDELGFTYDSIIECMSIHNSGFNEEEQDLILKNVRKKLKINRR